MRRLDWLDLAAAGAAIFLFFAILAGVTHKARSQTAHDAGHAQHHDVYKEWKQPGTQSSCCNEKKTVDGYITGDCYPTVAEIRAATWWAKRDNGVWVEIPDDRIVREMNPDPTGEGAHLCWNYGQVLCFRPPNTGG
jgi:hypothetical protein